MVERKRREARLRRRRDKEDSVGRRSWEGKEKNAREEKGRGDSQKRGAVVFIATGNRPSYVH